jgi:hypothetical protein
MPTNQTSPTRWVMCQIRDGARRFIDALRAQVALGHEYDPLPTAGETVHTSEWLEAAKASSAVEWTRDTLYQHLVSLPPEVVSHATAEIEAANSALSALAGKLESFPQTEA